MISDSLPTHGSLMLRLKPSRALTLGKAECVSVGSHDERAIWEAHGQLML